MKENIQAIYPLTPLQQGMLFHAIMDERQNAYFQQVRCRFEGKINEERMLRVWKQLTERHEMLRATFAWEHQREPMQIIWKNVEIPFECLDWSHRGSSVSEVALTQFLSEDLRKPFDLSKAPLMRLTCIQVDTDSFEMIWTHHHLLVDGWSTGLLFEEFQRRYEADYLREWPTFDDPLPFKDYLNWLKSRDSNESAQFWKSYLSGMEKCTAIPKDRGIDSDESIELVKPINADFTRRLNDFASSHKVTLNVLFLSCWALLLKKYSYDEEILIGVTVSGRPPELKAVEKRVGLFINSLPMRIAVPNDEGIEQWLKGNQQSLLQILEHQHSSQGGIRQQVDFQGDSPLFESLFVYENYPVSSTDEKAFGDLKLKATHIHERTNYPLTIVVEPLSGEMSLRVLFQPERILPRDMEQIAENYLQLLDNLIGSGDDNERKVGDVPMVSKEAHHRIVYDWNNTKVPYDTNVCMHTLFEQQVLRTPENIAVIDDFGSLSYLQLNHASNKIANTLMDAGVRPGDYIAVFFDRSKEMIPALLGILKAGASYVPIDVRNPGNRISYIISSLSIKFIISQDHHIDTLTATGEVSSSQVICLNSEAELVHNHDGLAYKLSENLQNPDLELSSASFAYVIFTSGSTGTPKGVTVKHQPVINLIEWITRAFGMNEQDRVLLVSSLSFDLSVYDIFGLLAVGGSIQVVGDEAIKDPSSLVRYLVNFPITFWDSAPAALQQLVPFLPEKAENAHLRLVFQSGDWIPLNLPDQMKSTFPGIDFIALGGATEATVWSNFYPVEDIDPTWKSIPYGRPIQNAAYYVLDENKQVCAPGIPGDLYIGGECLCSHYANEPELTSRKFVKDPFRESSDGRMYFTGDKACFYPDGNIEFLGRIDDQVKVRGYRIELGEIQSAIIKHDEIKSALAVVQEDNAGFKQIVAYYICDNGKSIEGDALKNWVSQFVPEYMVPAAAIQMEKFPITANGKLDRKALPLIDSKQPSTHLISKPQSELEQILWNSWEELLGEAPSSREVNFFEVGGHSLLATRLIARLNSALNQEIPVRGIFEYPILDEFVFFLKGILSDDAKMGVAWTRNTGKEYLPLSFAQERLWFLYQLQPDSPFYNVPLTIKISGYLDQKALKKAVSQLVQRHDILRTTYHVLDGAGRQKVHEHMDIPWEILDLSDALNPQSEALATLTREAKGPFHLERDCLVRCVLIEVASNEYYFQLTTHHIATDGWSITLLIKELGAFYVSEDASSSLAPLAFQYGDFGNWQRTYLEGGVMDKQLTYWREKLSHFQPLKIPTSQSVQNSVHGQTGMYRNELGEGLSKDLRAFARKENITLFVSLVSGFNLLMYHISGQTDIVIGTDMANRSHVNTEKMIGFFVNQIVLRSKLNAEMTGRQLLRQVRETALEAYQNQDLPFEKLVQDLNPPRVNGKTPFFNVKLVLQNNEMANLRLGELQVEPVNIETEATKYDLLVTFDDQPSLPVRIEYVKDAYLETDIERWWKSMSLILKQIVGSPNLKMADLIASLSSEGPMDEVQENRLEKLSKLRQLGRRKSSL